MDTKEKIIDIAFKKLCEVFKVTFIPRSVFEAELKSCSHELLAKLQSFVDGYLQACKSESRTIVQITKNQYVEDCFNQRFGWLKYSFKDAPILKKEPNYDRYVSDYEDHLVNGDKVVIPIFYIIRDEIKDWLTTDSTEKTVTELFWQYFYALVYEDKILKDDGYTIEQLDHKGFLESPELALDKFKKHYLSNEYLMVHHRMEMAIKDIKFPIFEFVVNVGTRKSEMDRSGWVNNSFEVTNQGNTYSYTTSAKDEGRINGPFVDVYIAQYEKRRLNKISAYSTETFETSYLMYRDLEKITIKNNCQVMISKHHGNETIIFDSKEEADRFQEKVMDIREGRRG